MITLALVFTCASAFAQDPVTKYLEGRFDGSEDGAAFVKKGSRSIGIKGGFRSFNASGDESTNTGYALLSMLNIGNGQLKVWNVSPNIQYFLSNDLSLGVSLDYTGYAVNTDIRLDLRDIVNSSNESLNLTLSNRAIQHHALGLSLVMRKYVPLFGSKYVAVFAEGRLQTSYGGTNNKPLDAKDYNRERVSGVFSVALKAGGGLAIKLKRSALRGGVQLHESGKDHDLHAGIHRRLRRYGQGPCHGKEPLPHVRLPGFPQSGPSGHPVWLCALY